MKPSPFAFARPGTLDEAVQKLADAHRSGGDAKVLAGGQSLLPLLSMRLAAPAMLVDINSIPGLDHVTTDTEGVRVGALARHSAVLRDEYARRVQPLVAMALANVAHPTIRNRGTTVGSLVHADAAAEMPAVLALLGGSVEAVSERGRRTIAAAELFAGPMESTLADDEIAVEAFFPVLAAGDGVGFAEIARRHGDYAMCGVAAIVTLDGDRVVAARASYLSVAEIPTVVQFSQSEGARLDDGWLARAGETALAELDPQADIHATAAYRSQLVRV
ncbi:MAG: FAD binding domain-containing protein, partial [Actinomycetota bacterium]|nr:FAD binding domain-containing protein [Actinomycetota bacterium]